MKIGVKSPLKRRRTPPTGPGVRQLHQRRLEKSRVRGGPRQGPAPDRPLRLALVAGAVLTVGTIFGAAIFHVLLIQSEFRAHRRHRPAAVGHGRSAAGRLPHGARSPGFQGRGRRTRRSRRAEPGRRVGGGEAPPWHPALATRTTVARPGPPGRPDRRTPLASRAPGGWGVPPRQRRREPPGSGPPRPAPGCPSPIAAWPPGGPRPRPVGPPPPAASPAGGPWRC